MSDMKQFSARERSLLLGVKGVGPTVIGRLEQLGYHGPLGPAARANAKAPGGRLLADAITRQLEVAELVLTGIDEVIPA